MAANQASLTTFIGVGPTERDAEDWFATVLAPHIPALRRYLARRVESAQVDDLLQAVCETAWRRRGVVPTDAALLWLYAVAANVVSNLRRTASRRQAIFTRYLPFLVAPDTAAPGVPGIENDQLAEAFARLDPDDRELLRLATWEDLDYREIAVLLGISDAAAATRLTRAKDRLRREMGATRTAQSPPDGA